MDGWLGAALGFWLSRKPIARFAVRQYGEIRPTAVKTAEMEKLMR